VLGASERAVERRLRSRKRERALRREQIRRLERPRQQLLRLDEEVDKAGLLRLIRRDDPAGEDEVLCEPEPSDPREPLRARRALP